MFLRCLISVLLVFISSFASAFTLNNTYWKEVGTAQNISPYLLYAIAIKETMMHKKGTKKGFVSPSLWAMNSPTTKSIYHQNREDLIQSIERLSAKKIRNIDIGVMQINVRWQAHRVNSIYDLTDPKTNIMVGSQILKESILSTKNIIRGVGRYHNPKDKRALKYGSHVLSIYLELVKFANVFHSDFAINSTSAKNIESILSRYLDDKHSEKAARKTAFSGLNRPSKNGMKYKNKRKFITRNSGLIARNNSAVLRKKKSQFTNNKFVDSRTVYDFPDWENRVFN